MRAFSSFILLILATLACGLPGVENTPTPPPTPTPEGDTLFFLAPYTIGLSPGTTIPGTEIRYIQEIDNLFEMEVEGLQAFRQNGNSLTWQGVIVPGVFGDYRLSLRDALIGQLQAEGEVEIAILNPTPVEVPLTQSPVGAIYFGPIPVQYNVPEGRRIPGTSLIFEGTRNEFAVLGGTAGYPYFAQDDSLLWLGKLRENVFVRYTMQVDNINEYGLTLSGSAELWLSH